MSISIFIEIHPQDLEGSNTKIIFIIPIYHSLVANRYISWVIIVSFASAFSWAIFVTAFCYQISFALRHRFQGCYVIYDFRKIEKISEKIQKKNRLAILNHIPICIQTSYAVAMNIESHSLSIKTHIYLSLPNRFDCLFIFNIVFLSAKYARN